MLQTFKINKQTASPILDSQIRLFSAKTVASVVVFFSLIISWLVPELSFFDAIGSGLLGIYMIFSAWQITSAAVPDLIDCALEERIKLIILESLIEYEALYQRIDQVHTKRTGTEMHVDIHLSFKADQSFSSVVDSIEKIRASIQSKVPNLAVAVLPSL